MVVYKDVVSARDALIKLIAGIFTTKQHLPLHRTTAIQLHVEMGPRDTGSAIALVLLFVGPHLIHGTPSECANNQLKWYDLATTTHADASPRITLADHDHTNQHLWQANPNSFLYSKSHANSALSFKILDGMKSAASDSNPFTKYKVSVQCNEDGVIPFTYEFEDADGTIHKVNDESCKKDTYTVIVPQQTGSFSSGDEVLKIIPLQNGHDIGIAKLKIDFTYGTSGSQTDETKTFDFTTNLEGTSAPLSTTDTNPVPGADNVWHENGKGYLEYHDTATELYFEVSNTWEDTNTVPVGIDIKCSSDMTLHEALVVGKEVDSSTTPTVVPHVACDKEWTTIEADQTNLFSKTISGTVFLSPLGIRNGASPSENGITHVRLRRDCEADACADGHMDEYALDQLSFDSDGLVDDDGNRVARGSTSFDSSVSMDDLWSKSYHINHVSGKMPLNVKPDLKQFLGNAHSVSMSIRCSIDIDPFPYSFRYTNDDGKEETIVKPACLESLAGDLFENLAFDPGDGLDGVVQILPTDSTTDNKVDNGLVELKFKLGDCDPDASGTDCTEAEKKLHVITMDDDRLGSADDGVFTSDDMAIWDQTTPAHLQMEPTSTANTGQHEFDLDIGVSSDPYLPVGEIKFEIKCSHDMEAPVTFHFGSSKTVTGRVCGTEWTELAVVTQLSDATDFVKMDAYEFGTDGGIVGLRAQHENCEGDFDDCSDEFTWEWLAEDNPIDNDYWQTTEFSLREDYVSPIATKYKLDITHDDLVLDVADWPKVTPPLKLEFAEPPGYQSVNNDNLVFKVKCSSISGNDQGVVKVQVDGSTKDDITCNGVEASASTTVTTGAILEKADLDETNVAVWLSHGTELETFKAEFTYNAYLAGTKEEYEDSVADFTSAAAASSDLTYAASANGDPATLTAADPIADTTADFTPSFPSTYYPDNTDTGDDVKVQFKVTCTKPESDSITITDSETTPNFETLACEGSSETTTSFKTFSTGNNADSDLETYLNSITVEMPDGTVLTQLEVEITYTDTSGNTGVTDSTAYAPPENDVDLVYDDSPTPATLTARPGTYFDPASWSSVTAPNDIASSTTATIQVKFTCESNSGFVYVKNATKGTATACDGNANQQGYNAEGLDIDTNAKLRTELGKISVGLTSGTVLTNLKAVLIYTQDETGHVETYEYDLGRPEAIYESTGTDFSTAASSEDLTYDSSASTLTAADDLSTITEAVFEPDFTGAYPIDLDTTAAATIEFTVKCTSSESNVDVTIVDSASGSAALACDDSSNSAADFKVFDAGDNKDQTDLNTYLDGITVTMPDGVTLKELKVTITYTKTGGNAGETKTIDYTPPTSHQNLVYDESATTLTADVAVFFSPESWSPSSLTVPADILEDSDYTLKVMFTCDGSTGRVYVTDTVSTTVATACTDSIDQEGYTLEKAFDTTESIKTEIGALKVGLTAGTKLTGLKAVLVYSNVENLVYTPSDHLRGDFQPGVDIRCTENGLSLPMAYKSNGAYHKDGITCHHDTWTTLRNVGPIGDDPNLLELYPLKYLKDAGITKFRLYAKECDPNDGTLAAGAACRDTHVDTYDMLEYTVDVNADLVQKPIASGSSPSDFWKGTGASILYNTLDQAWLSVRAPDVGPYSNPNNAYTVELACPSFLKTWNMKVSYVDKDGTRSTESIQDCSETGGWTALGDDVMTNISRNNEAFRLHPIDFSEAAGPPRVRFRTSDGCTLPANWIAPETYTTHTGTTDADYFYEIDFSDAATIPSTLFNKVDMTDSGFEITNGYLHGTADHKAVAILASDIVTNHFNSKTTDFIEVDILCSKDGMTLPQDLFMTTGQFEERAFGQVMCNSQTYTQLPVPLDTKNNAEAALALVTVNANTNQGISKMRFRRDGAAWDLTTTTVITSVASSTDSVASSTDSAASSTEHPNVVMMEGQLCLPGSHRHITFAQVDEELGLLINLWKPRDLILPVPPGDWTHMEVEALVHFTEESIYVAYIDFYLGSTMFEIALTEDTHKIFKTNVSIPTNKAMSIPIHAKMHADGFNVDSKNYNAYIETLDLRAVHESKTPCEDPDPCESVIKKSFSDNSKWIADSFSFLKGDGNDIFPQFAKIPLEEQGHKEGFSQYLWTLRQGFNSQGLALYVPELKNDDVTSFSLDILCNTKKGDTMWEVNTVNADLESGLNPSFAFKCNYPNANGWITIPYPIVIDDQQRDGVVGYLLDLDPASASQTTPRGSGPAVMRIRPRHCLVESDQYADAKSKTIETSGSQSIAASMVLTMVVLALAWWV